MLTIRRQMNIGRWIISGDNRMLWRKVNQGNSVEKDLNTILGAVKKDLFIMVTFEPRLEWSRGERYLNIYRQRNLDRGKNKSGGFKICHKFFDILFSRDGTYFPSPWTWVDLVTYFLQNLRPSDGVWFLRLGHKWHGSFHLNFPLWSLAVDKTNCHVVRTLKQSSANISSILIWLDLCIILSKLRLFRPSKLHLVGTISLLSLLQPVK